MSTNTAYRYLVHGPIDFAEAAAISASGDHTTGADLLFLGVIRANEVNGQRVKEIEYSAYEPMAETVFGRIEAQVMEKHGIASITIRHSVGTVRAGEISMLVYVRSKHRAEAYAANRDAVELIKAHAPVWKKELYENGTHAWPNCERCAAGHHHHHDHDHHGHHHHHH